MRQKGGSDMADYYVTHPNLSISAIVHHAPTTEKARTTFLDYLERTGRWPRSRRQELRANMVAERVSDSFGLDADVELNYDYEPEPEAELPIGYYGSGGGEVPEYVEPEEEPVEARSPIQELSLGVNRGD